MPRPSFVSAGLAALLFAAPLAAQDTGLNVGDVAPDFSLPAATKAGVTAAPVKLSALRGQTVVLAFFYKARTAGCGHQMDAYRDQYNTLFKGGKGVSVIAISVDPDTTLASWAKEKDLPFTLASDAGGALGQKYGVFNAKAGLDSRVLFIVGPDGKITYRAKPFHELVESEYTDLGSAVRKTAGE